MVDDQGARLPSTGTPHTGQTQARQRRAIPAYRPPSSCARPGPAYHQEVVGNAFPPRDRLRPLVDSLLAIGTDLDRRQASERVVHAAAKLADARCAILQLAWPYFGVVDLVGHGLRPEECRERSRRPDFQHIVEQVRLCGRPMGHGNLIGVPLHLREEFHGLLCVGGKRVGGFTSTDQETLAAYGPAATMALHNACLYEYQRRRRHWWQSASELTHLLLGEVERDQALRLVTRRLREVSGAACGVLFLVDPDEPDTGTLHAVDGLGMEHMSGARVPVRSLTAKVLESGRGIVTADLTSAPGYEPLPEWRAALAPLGLAMLLPLTAEDETVGVLFAGWSRGSPDEPMAAQEISLVGMFANQAALALRQTRAQENRAALRVLEDRDRIARDLHDVVLRRLHQIGADLRDAVPLSRRPEVRGRIDGAVEDVDDTIRRVRAVIFQLHEREARWSTLRSHLDAEVDAAREAFGITPLLRLDTDVDALPPGTQRELAIGVHEALGLASERWTPRCVDVDLTRARDRVRMAVTYDEPTTARRAERDHPTGLETLATRARRLGGTCTAVANRGGTTIEWEVPVG